MVVASLCGIIITSKLSAVNDCVKMKPLAVISHIDDPSGLLLSYSVTKGCEIGCVITITTVSFLNHQGDLALRYKDTFGAVTLGKDSSGCQIFDHWFDQRVVERLTLVLDMDIKTIIDALELLLRDGAKQLPSFEGALITLL